MRPPRHPRRGDRPPRGEGRHGRHRAGGGGRVRGQAFARRVAGGCRRPLAARRPLPGRAPRASTTNPSTQRCRPSPPTVGSTWLATGGSATTGVLRFFGLVDVQAPPGDRQVTWTNGQFTGRTFVSDGASLAVSARSPVAIPAPFTPVTVVFDTRSKLYEVATSQLGILSITASGAATAAEPDGGAVGRAPGVRDARAAGRVESGRGDLRDEKRSDHLRSGGRRRVERGE